MAPDNFCVFILTHGRPDSVATYRSLRDYGYSGPIWIVIDDDDKTGAAYREKFGAQVLTFSKSEVAARIDEGDNFSDRRAILYARNACFDLAKKVGASRFIQLDDDYTSFHVRYMEDGSYGTTTGITKSEIGATFLDEALCIMLRFFERCRPVLCLAMSQGGDHLGGGDALMLKRKIMNSLICSTERPFRISGRLNEDVNTYTAEARAGGLFFTAWQIMLVQKQTQANAGGMTDIYKAQGTYIKSLYSVMYCPSAVKIHALTDDASDVPPRIHHKVRYDHCAPKILRESVRRPR